VNENDEKSTHDTMLNLLYVDIGSSKSSILQHYIYCIQQENTIVAMQQNDKEIECSKLEESKLEHAHWRLQQLDAYKTWTGTDCV
jgi:hypothetical protein